MHAHRAVDVWFVDFGTVEEPAAGEDLLSDDERQRARSFRVRAARDGYVRTRGALRLFLGVYSGLDPTSLHIGTGACGKPLLPDRPDLEFNLSHSGDMAAFAFAEECPVGIDIEAVRTLARLDGLARRALHPAEYRAWRAAEPRDALENFFRRWSRREAVVKATGEGLGPGLEAFGVLTRPDGSLQVTWDDGASRPEWWVADLDPPAGYVAAIAAARPVRLRVRSVPGLPDAATLQRCGFRREERPPEGTPPGPRPIGLPRPEGPG